MARIMVVFGTRPEAIKMFPVVAALRAQEGLEVRVVVTAQHRELLDQVLALIGLEPDYDLDVMAAGQSLEQLAARLILQLGPVFAAERPDCVVVHGDTLTAAMAAQVAYFHKIPVAHVEAGLRSGDIYQPWPEEVNRRMIGSLADMHFAPTQTAADALTREGIAADRIAITGNTVIDALLSMRQRIAELPQLTGEIGTLLERFAGRHIIAVTAHRRENLAEGIGEIAAALRQIAARPDVAVIFPLHPNPQLRSAVEPILGALDNIALTHPLDYPNFVALLDRAHIVLTDSGGVQEEAPSLGKPVLVLRHTTERPEGVHAGTAKLVGTDSGAIVRAVTELLDDPATYQRMAQAHNPYGDGHAASRIAAMIARRYAAALDQQPSNEKTGRIFMRPVFLHDPVGPIEVM